MKKISVITLACLFAFAAPVGAQGLLEGMNQKLDAILKAIQALPSVPPTTVPPPVITPCVTKFCPGDRISPVAGSGGVRARTVPGGEENFAVAESDKGTVTDTTTLAGANYVQAQWDSGVRGWTGENPICKIPCSTTPPPVVVPPPVVPPVVIAPPPVINPVPGASFYLSTAGNDVNDGSLEKPFKTLQKAVPLLGPGNKLIVRAGIYDTGGFTKQGADTIFTTGLSWDKPIQIHAAPGEKVIFVRDPPPDSKFTIEQIRAGVHAPTQADCAYYASLFPGQGLYLPWPENCLSGGSARGGLYEFQDNTGASTGSLLDFVNAQHPVGFIEFKDITFDGRGISRNIFSSSTSATTGDATAHDIRFVNADIGYSGGSCFAQPGGVEKNFKGEPVMSNISWIDSKLHHCGVPFDPNRRMSAFKYLHFAYLDQGGNQLIRSECYLNAGGCFEPSGPGNMIIDSYIHDNSCLGAQVGGGPGMIVKGTVFYNNGCGELQLLSEAGHTFQHNTIVCGPANKALGLQITFRNSLIADNIVSGCATSIYSLQPWDTPNRITKNLIDGLLTIGPNTVAPVVSGTIQADPMFVDAAAGNYALKPGSPAIKAATDGGNIGAK